jgi:uncharacterized membrane protein YraQ (UPF0718 family)
VLFLRPWCSSFNKVKIKVDRKFVEVTTGKCLITELATLSMETEVLAAMKGDYMKILYIVTSIAMLVSIIADWRKTIKAIETGIKKMFKIMPKFLQMLIMVAFILYFIPDKVIIKYLGKSAGGVGTLLGLSFGTITMMPGFIAFPLAGILLEKGVSYMNIAAFTTTLMIVGVVTFPIEKEYFGIKVTVLRNIIGFLIAVLVTILVGMFYGEVF